MEKVSSSVLAKLKKELRGISTSVKMPKIDKNFKIPTAVGCKVCNSTGYKGRAGIFEALVIDDEMKKFILTSPSITALRERAIKKGMLTMHHDGLLKVLEGITTIEEIERVTGEE